MDVDLDSSATFLKKIHSVNLRTVKWSKPASAEFSWLECIDVIHVHGVWCRIARDMLRVARQRGIPVVQAPHGALGAWAMSQKALKKKLALRWLIRPLMSEVRFFHVNNTQEEIDLRRLSISKPIEMIPHGISTKELNKAGSGSTFRTKYLHN